MTDLDAVQVVVLVSGAVYLATYALGAIVSLAMARRHPMVAALTLISLAALSLVVVVGGAVLGLKMNPSDQVAYAGIGGASIILGMGTAGLVVASAMGRLRPEDLGDD